MMRLSLTTGKNNDGEIYFHTERLPLFPNSLAYKQILNCYQTKDNLFCVLALILREPPVCLLEINLDKNIKARIATPQPAINR
ncbi:MAG: hypothetical protein WAO71_14480 [Gallionella sp.]